MDEFGLSPGQPSGEELGRILWTRQHGGDDYGWDQARADGSWKTWAHQAAQYWNAGTFGNGGDQIPISGVSARPNQPPPPQNAPPPSSPPVGNAPPPPAGNFGLGPGQPSGQELGKILWTRQHGGNPYGWEQAVSDGSWTTWATAAAQLWNQGKFGNGGDQIPISGTPYNGALSPGVTSPGAPGTTTVNVGSDLSSAFRIGGGPGSGPVETKFGTVTGEFGLPGNMGLGWWQTFGQMMSKLTDDSGTVYNPLTNQPMTNADGSLQKTLAAIANAAQIRQKDTDLQQSQQRLDDARRAGDLDREQQELQYQRTLQLDRDRLTQNQTQFDATLGFNVSQAVGRFDGQNTLERDVFENQREQQLYSRAANPALSFENELARGGGGSFYNPQAGRVESGVSTQVVPVTMPQAAVFGGAPAVGAATVGDPTVVDYTASGMPSPDSANGWYTGPREPGRMYAMDAQPQAGGMRVPAVIEAFRSGQLTPGVGRINTASTMRSPQQAALTRRDFELGNLKNEANYSPTQRAIRSSFGRAGGVSDEDQDWIIQRGMPKERSVAAVYHGR